MDGTGEAVESMLNIWLKTKERLASNVGLGGTTCYCCALRLRDGVPGGTLSFCCALRVRDETPGEEPLFFGMTAKSCVSCLRRKMISKWRQKSSVSCFLKQRKEKRILCLLVAKRKSCFFTFNRSEKFENKFTWFLNSGISSQSGKSKKDSIIALQNWYLQILYL